MKTAATAALFLLLSCAPLLAAPTSSPLASAPKATLADLLDREIGSGHILQITMKPVGAKPAETMLATVQGRTDTQFFISRVHFRIYPYASGGGMVREGAPPDLFIQMDQLSGHPVIQTYPLTDAAAVRMLETNPRHFILGKVYTTYAAAEMLSPDTVAEMEWLHVPASALPHPALPLKSIKPARINPSLSPLWP